MGFGSFLERTAKSLRGVVGGAKEMAEISVDIINPFDNEGPEDWTSPGDIAGSALNAIFTDIEEGVDEAMPNFFGPEGAIGAPVGGLPEGFRDSARRNVVEPAARMGDAAQHQVNAFAMAGGAAGAGQIDLDDVEMQDGQLGLSPDSRQMRALDRADEQSVGQSAIIALHGRDPLDPASADDLFENPMWRVTSGTLDLLSAWYVPDALEGVAFGVRTARRASRAARTPGLKNTPREVVDKFVNESTHSWVPGKAGDFTARNTGSGSGIGSKIRDRFMESGFDRWEALIDDNWQDIRRSIDDTALADNTARRIEIAKTHQAAQGKVDDLRTAIGDADVDPFTQGALDVREGNVLSAADEMEKLDLEATHLKETFERDVNQRLATRIYDQMGGDQVVHQPLANALAHAGSKAERELVWRTFAGDPDAVAQLRRMNDELAMSVDTTKWSQQFSGDDTLIGEQATSAFLNQPAHLQSLQKTSVKLRERRRRIERIEELQGWGAQGPLPQAPGAVGRAFKQGKEHVWSKIDSIDPITGRARYLWDKVPGNVWDMNNNLFMDRINGWMGDVGIDAAERELYRGRLMEQSNAAGRFRVLSELEDSIVRRQADDIGVDRNVVNYVLKVAQEARGNNRKVMSSGAKYGAIRTKDGDIHLPDDPVVRGQFADTFTPVDTAASKDALRRFKKWQDKNPDAADRLSQALSVSDMKPGALGTLGNFAQEAVEGLHSLWKLGKVARPAFWPRAFGLDEMPRLMSAMGSMAAVSGMAKGTVRGAGQFFASRGARGGAAAGGFAALTLGGGLPGAAVGVALGAAFGVPAARMSQRVSRLGLVDDAMGDTVDMAAANRARVAPSAQFDDFISEGSQLASDALGGTGIRQTGVFDYIAPESDKWAGAWERVVNRQARRDPLFRMGLEGASREQMVTWLRSDEGLDYLHEFTGYVEDLDFIEVVDRQIGFRDALFGGSEELRRIALEREVSAADLDGRLPVSERTVISGEDFRELERRGMGAVTGFLGDNIGKPLVELFASIPADEMLRMPYYQHRYKEALLGLERSGLDVDDAQRATWRKQARQQALKDTEDMFYSHASRSRFAQMVRFISPFFAPAENAIRSWARLTVDNPLFTARLVNQYRELQETLQVTDEGESKFAVAPEPIADMLRMLPWMKDVPEGIGASLYPESLNMIFQGPGLGPGVNIMFEDYVRNRPELQDEPFFKMLFPYGVDAEGNIATDFLTEMTPTVVARLQNQFGDEDRMNSLVNTLVAEAKVQMDQGLIPSVRKGDDGWNEFVEQKEREARSVLALDAAAKLWSPSSVTIQTWSDPYKRDLSQEHERGDVKEMVDGEMVTTTPIERFLRRNGDEYLAVAQSMYDNRLSLATSLETLDALEDPELADWIERAAAEDPQMARWVVGSNGAGSEAQNSYFAFQKMKGMEAGAGTRDPLVELKSPVDLIDNPDIQRGWEEYSAIMAEVDNLAEERGYTSLYVKDAQWLRDTRDEIVAGLAQEYPAWNDEFNQSVDRGQWDRRLTMMEDVASDDLFGERAGMTGMREYLDGRRTVESALAGREFSTLTAQANEDLRLAYEEFVTTLVYQYPAFGEQFHYLIENADPFLTEFDGEEIDNG